MRIPNVPHDVPVANASNAPIINIIAGNSDSHGPDIFSTNDATYSFAPRLSVIDFNVHANTRIRIAGTIALNPSGIQLQHSVKPSTLLTE